MRSEPQQFMDYAKWILAGMASLLHSIPELTWFLMLLMLIDAVFGVLVAIKNEQKIDHKWAWGGATRKLGSLGIIIVASLVDRYINFLGLDLVTMSTVFYLGPEILGILTKAAVLGVPVPPQFSKVLAYLQEKNDAPANTEKSGQS